MASVQVSASISRQNRFILNHLGHPRNRQNTVNSTQPSQERTSTDGKIEPIIEIPHDGPVQKKPEAWDKLLRLDLDLRLEQALPPPPRHSMIILASLVNGAANIGGLTRTAEIFNVEALVVDNLKV